MIGKVSAYRVLLALGSMLGAGVLAQSPEAGLEGVPVERLEEVIVTGTFAPRTQFESMAPIDVLQQEDLQRTASDELMDTLAQLVPSFNVQRLPLADGQIYVRPARLRNLSPDHTLVLVNGKRRHRSALLGSNGAQAPDLFWIPPSAIKRVEVLRDGASAQYGSDAIAGVINIILDDAEGVHAFGQWGEYDEGDGTQLRGGIRAGVDLDTGYLNATFEYQDSDPTSRSRQREDAIAFQMANPDVSVRNPVQNWGQPERESTRFAVNGAYVLGAVEAYGFGTYGFGEGVSDFNWRNPDSTSAFLPSSAFPDFDLRAVFPAGFSPQFGQDDEDLSLFAGVRSLDSKLSWDLSLGFGENEIDYFIFDTINASLGPQSPTAFDPGTLTQSQLTLNLNLAYDLALGLHQPVHLALGLEAREEEYEIEAGDPASFAIGPGAVDGLPSGSNGFPGFSEAQAGSFDQTSYAAFVDVDAPVTDRLTLGAALRYEDYSEFGDNVDGKLSARFALTPELALRSTVSTGFRAPTPGQLFSERTSQGLDTVTLNIFTAGRFSPEGAVAAVINERPEVSIEELSAEESVNISAGIVWESGPYSVTVDAYQVDVDDRFGTSETFNPTAAEQARFVELGIPGGEGISRVNFFQNDFDTQTRGIDIVASMVTALGDSTLKLTAAYNYNETEVEGGDLSQNETQRIRFEELLPEHSANLAANLTLGRLDFLGRIRYYGEWTDFSFNEQGDIFQEFGDEFFLDLAVAYQLTEKITVRIAAENVLDEFPDEAEFQKSRGLIYSRNAPYDTDGAFYFMRLDVSL